MVSFFNKGVEFYDITKAALLGILCFLLISFGLCLFKNIQYPLLWNDEGETAMYAKHILQYGYPKIHDEKNIVWLNEFHDKKIGMDEKNDAPSSLVWGQYYFAAIGAFFAEMSNDIYLKTALMRIPFALAGLAGLIIMALSIISLFGKDALRRLTFLIIFSSGALASVTLMLHLRQVRHPALVLFLSACILCAYFNYRYYGKIKSLTYFASLTLLLFLLYHVFHVVCFVFSAAIGTYEFFVLLRKKDIKVFMINMAPVFAAFILMSPFFFLSQTFRGGVLSITNNRWPAWDEQLFNVAGFFQKYEFFYTVLAVRAIFLSLAAYCSAKGPSIAPAAMEKMRISNFLSLYFVIYLAVIAFFPAHVIYQRYFIALLPIQSMIISLDIFGIFELLAQFPQTLIKNTGRALAIMVVLFSLSINWDIKISNMRKYVYELTHQYKGPLDFAIPFIKSRYKDTENLIIATNYEELCYMYYLKSKVIVGFVGNNLDEDLKMRPDIIIFRRRGTYVRPQVFDQFLKRDKYKRIALPVADYFVNNIPQIESHLYETLFCTDEKYCLYVFIRTD